VGLLVPKPDIKFAAAFITAHRAMKNTKESRPFPMRKKIWNGFVAMIESAAASGILKP
jgi:hypothetical protein